MTAKKIKGEILEAKVFPICAECKYLIEKEISGIFWKKRYAGCSAIGYKYAESVHGTENCKGAYVNQLKLPMIESVDIKITGVTKDEI